MTAIIFIEFFLVYWWNSNYSLFAQFWYITQETSDTKFSSTFCCSSCSVLLCLSCWNNWQPTTPAFQFSPHLGTPAVPRKIKKKQSNQTENSWTYGSGGSPEGRSKENEGRKRVRWWCITDNTTEYSEKLSEHPGHSGRSKDKANNQLFISCYLSTVSYITWLSFSTAPKTVSLSLTCWFLCI